jgi:hypothetical protein
MTKKISTSLVERAAMLGSSVIHDFGLRAKQPTIAGPGTQPR